MDKQRVLRQRTGAFVTCAALCLTGCAPAFKETYYLGVYDRKDPATPMQFYRFRMAGTVDFGSKFKFQTGWYPKHALQQFVGESRDIGGTGARHDPGMDALIVGPEGAVEALRDQYLVVLMATDPSPATNALASFAQAANSEGVVAAKAYREQRMERIRQKSELKRARTRAGLSLIESTLRATGNATALPLLEQLTGVVLPQLDSMKSEQPAQPAPASAPVTGDSEDGQ